MAHYDDLSDYVYAQEAMRPRTKAIGWLGRGHAFSTIVPEKETLDLLWLYCSISIAQTRGVHECEFCLGSGVYQAERNGERLLLGSAEIRVFSLEGIIYAAPTLIYHYVTIHNYKPPDEFIHALRSGPRPPSQEYFDALAGLNLEWSRTSRGAPKNRILLYPNPNAENKTYLDKIGTLSDISRWNLKLEEGLIVHFYRPESDDKNNRDDIFFEGTVHFDMSKNEWYAIIDPKSYQRQSELG